MKRRVLERIAKLLAPEKPPQKGVFAGAMSFAIRSLYCLLFIVSSCGYQRGQGGVLDEYRTISVPYVQGDKDGNLTASIIKAVDTSGPLRYTPNSGDLILLANIVEIRDENIGFRYYEKKKHRRTNAIIPTETRKTALVEVVVHNSKTGCPVMGPARLLAYMDFDHEYFSSNENQFSLGQLTDVEDAQDAVQRPLNAKMAQKIVDFLYGSWE